jgi:hypothetical protein
MVAGAVIGVLVSAGLAATCLAIAVESSEGNDQVYAWPTANVIDWFPELIYLVIAALVSAFPGWFIARNVAVDSAERVLWVGGSLLICFPIVVLSQLHSSSAAAVLSGGVLLSVLFKPISWAFFYLEAALLAAMCVAATIAVASAGTLLAVLLVPLYVLALFVYFRLLGRLGWYLAETTKVVESESVEEG